MHRNKKKVNRQEGGLANSPNARTQYTLEIATTHGNVASPAYSYVKFCCSMYLNPEHS